MANTIYLPHYTEGTDAYTHIARICQRFGSRVLLLVGRHGYDAAKNKLLAAIADSGLTLSEPIDASGDCTLAKITRLQSLPATKDADMIFAVGGAKVLDSAKALGEQVGKPVFTFPTIASNCAATTTVSIVYREDGAFDHPYFLSSGPAHCFIDTEILAQAPAKYLWAGMGDTYAKYYEAEISSRADTLDHAKALGLLTSQSCADLILQHGEAALVANRAQTVNEALTQVALAILVNTGIVSILVTLDHSPDYNSDLAHALYYTFTSIPDYDHEQLHGAVVAYGVLILLTMDQAYNPLSSEALEQLRAFNKAVGLPLGTADIGLTPEIIAPYLQAVCQMPDVRHRPYPVTETALREAILTQDRWRYTHAPDHQTLTHH